MENSKQEEHNFTTWFKYSTPENMVKNFENPQFTLFDIACFDMNTLNIPESVKKILKWE